MNEYEDLIKAFNSVEPSKFEAVIPHIINDKLLLAIKAIRAETGLGLYEAKAITDKLAAFNKRCLFELYGNLRNDRPEYFL